MAKSPILIQILLQEGCLTRRPWARAPVCSAAQNLEAAATRRILVSQLILKHFRLSG